MKYAPLHNHSMYSSLDGLSTPLEIAQRCQEIGVTACGCTDHGTVAGHLEFGQVMREWDITPIYGCELYHGVLDNPTSKDRDSAHLIAGALNDEGLRNLWRLVSASASNFYKRPRVTWEMLREHSEGLFVTSACVQGLVSQGIQNEDYEALNKYLEIFGDRFYIELHTYPTDWQREINEQLVHQAEYRGIPVVYATDAHFAHPSQFEIHDAYVAMNTGDNILMDPSERTMWHPKSLYIQAEDEIRSSLSYLPGRVVDEALSNSHELAEACDAELPDVDRHLPVFIPAKSPWIEQELCEVPRSAAEAFIDLVEKGLQRRYKPISDEVSRRARHEVKTLLDAGLESYFLIVWDICRFSDSEGIKRGPGRGSGAGSIVAYALGITDIDPIRFGLIFERFYNAGREDSWPDIDLDFPQEARGKVRDYLSQRWGEQRVRTIGNVRRMAPRETLNRTYSVCGVTFEEMSDLKKIVEQVPDMDILTLEHVGWSRESDPGKTVYIMDHVGEQIAEWVRNCPEDRQPVIEQWLELVDVVCTRVSGYGVHASGIVVSDVDLDEELPAMWSANQKILTTQFAMGDVEKRGHAKIDILGLRNLDTLQEWERLTGDEIIWNELPDREQPEGLWNALDKGQTLGIFQLEGDYARSLCKQLKARDVEDLSALVALNRPGPIRSGTPDAFIARREGSGAIYDHEMLEPILRETYGLWLYQEQVIRFFHELGYDLQDADSVRKILGKKKPTEMAQLYKGTGPWKGKGFKDIAGPILGDSTDKIWKQIEGFANYSFNKAHAVSYGMFSLGTVWAKYRVREFLISSMQTNPERVGAYVAEARKMGIEVMPPDIIKSDSEVSIVDGKIYFGLSYIKGIKDLSAQLIVKHLRMFYDISSPELLRQALDEETLLWQEAPKAARSKLSPKTKLKANQIKLLEEVGAFDNYTPRDVPLHKKQKAEKDHLEVILTDNTKEAFANNEELVSKCDSYDTLQEEDKVWLPGVVSKVTPKVTRKDKRNMGIISIEYGGDEVEFAVFPNLWDGYKWLFKERTPGIFNLRRTNRGISFEKGIKLQ